MIQFILYIRFLVCWKFDNLSNIHRILFYQNHNTAHSLQAQKNDSIDIVVSTTYEGVRGKIFHNLKRHRAIRFIIGERKTWVSITKSKNALIYLIMPTWCHFGYRMTAVLDTSSFSSRVCSLIVCCKHGTFMWVTAVQVIVFKYLGWYVQDLREPKNAMATRPFQMLS